MSEGLNRLAQAYGIEPSYVSETGEHRIITDDVKRGLLGAMLHLNLPGIAALEAEPHIAPLDWNEQQRVSGASRCFTPDWMDDARVWGVTVQLYGVRSERNHGIGDFEDLAQLAEMTAQHGADFIGVNPLHALFATEPDRCSPYSPSTRLFLNPLYIALDRLAGGAAALASVEPVVLRRLRHAPMVDYVGVAALKRRVLAHVFRDQHHHDDARFAAFREREGEQLVRFAQFETLADTMARRGLGSGWHSWPGKYQDRRSQAVVRFAAEHADDVLWHQWLQWIASEQLAEAQARAGAAGMRIGLYLDLAVGVAPDGAATWADPDLVTAQATVGAPPDMFNEMGQDWGLAPMVPRLLIERDMAPFERDVAALMRSAGAIRIDHAMGLQRLYWIPRGFDARSGAFVRYPMNRMLDCLTRLSHRYRTIVIGEDLGTVPPGFRDVMRERHIHSYRVFYFERRADGSFIDARDYPSDALACVGTHDLPTLRGWWRSEDVTARKQLGLSSEGFSEAAYRIREHGRRQLLISLAHAGLIHDELRQTAFDGGRALPGDLPDAAFIALHAYVARTPSRLFAAQIEDMSGAIDQVNLPGTHMEYPNWRRKLPCTIDELETYPLFVHTTAAVAQERRRAT